MAFPRGMSLDIFPGGAFTPLSLSGLELWFDPSDSDTITLNAQDRLTSYLDKSGNNNHASNDTGDHKMPKSGLRSQNGLNMLEFYGDEWINTPSISPHRTNPTTTFCVAKQDDTIDRYLFGGVDSTGRRIIFGNSGTYRAWAGNNLTGPAIDMNPHIFGAVYDGANSAFYVDDNSYTGNTGSNSYSGHNIGSRHDNSTRWNGIIGEFITYNRALSAGEVAKVQAYLNDKWAVY